MIRESIRLFLPFAGKHQHLFRNHRCLGSFGKFRDQLKEFPGGSVDLIKNNETGIATITMNNPDKKNAFTGKMMVDFEECVSELENWTTGKGVVLVGKGNTFCSGGDLETVKQLLFSGEDMCKFMHNVTSRLYNLPMVSVAAVNGYALGGGAELTTACDFRIMTPEAKIGFVQVKFNIAPGWGGGTRLVQILGRTKALQLLSSGNIMNSEFSQRIGLVNDILANGVDILEQGHEWLLDNCKGDFTATRVLKQMVLAAEKLDSETSLEEERRLFTSVWGNELHAKAVHLKPKHK